MLDASAPFIAAEYGCQNLVIADSNVSSNIVQLRYAVFLLGAVTDNAVARFIRIPLPEEL